MKFLKQIETKGGYTSGKTAHRRERRIKRGKRHRKIISTEIEIENSIWKIIDKKNTEKQQ